MFVYLDDLKAGHIPKGRTVRVVRRRDLETFSVWRSVQDGRRCYCVSNQVLLYKGAAHKTTISEIRGFIEKLS